MFDVDGMTIRLKQGETGAARFRFIGYDFQAVDRVIFKVRQGTKTIIRTEYTPDENGAIVVYFLHNTTILTPGGEAINPGTYAYDIGIVLNPYRDSDGKIQDGDQVLYPYDSQTLIIESSAGL